jgi:hypothetical protein
MAGSHLTLNDGGEHDLRGEAGRWRVYLVD